jgi:hypothetical protein
MLICHLLVISLLMVWLDLVKAFGKHEGRGSLVGFRGQERAGA